jgi:4-hydroxy-tetrahydrodipicolinate reductase
MKHDMAGGRKRLISISIFGLGGRMGKAIEEALAGSSKVNIDQADPDVFVDFTVPEAVDKHLNSAVSANRPILIGTTGLTAEHQKMIDAASQHVAIIQAANTSLGVHLLAHLVRESAARLGPEWDIEIVEMHHRLKIDSPSGTALMLGEAAAAGRGVALDAAAERGRDGMTGPRAPGAIGFAALRGGTVAGDHLAVFAGEGERLELGHRAESRAIFARGAIAAALWLAGRPAGRYAMADVLGLR